MASVPVLVKRIRSAHLIAFKTASAASTSRRWVMAKVVPSRAAVDHGLGDKRIGVAEDDRSPRTLQVDVSLAVHVPDVSALAAIDDEGVVVTEIAESARHSVDKIGSGALKPLRGAGSLHAHEMESSEICDRPMVGAGLVRQLLGVWTVARPLCPSRFVTPDRLYVEPGNSVPPENAPGGTR